MERLQQNKVQKKWKEVEKVASQSATKSQAPRCLRIIPDTVVRLLRQV